MGGYESYGLKNAAAERSIHMNKKRMVTAAFAAAILLGQTVSEATMFTMNFSEGAYDGFGCIRLTSGTGVNMDYQDGMFAYPIKYSLYGGDPVAGEVYDKSDKPVFEDGVYTVSAGVYTDGDEAISDTYHRVYVCGSPRNVAKQTDKSKISYEAYTETNGRYPDYMFDGDNEFGGIAASYTYKNNDITVSYDDARTANLALITMRVNAVAVDGAADGSGGHNSGGTSDTKIEKTKSDISIKLDIKYKDDTGSFVSASGGAQTLLIPKGSNVTFTRVKDYGALWTTVALPLDNFTSDEIMFSLQSGMGITSIKEIELYEANKKTYTVKMTPGGAKLRSGARVALHGNAEADCCIRYTTDGTPPDEGSQEYSGEISLEDGIHTIRAAIFDADGRRLSDIFDGRYIVGNRTNVGEQKNSAKISYSGSFSNGRNPEYAFDGDGSFWQIAYAWEFKKNIPVTVSYDAPITVDTIAMPVRIAAAAFDGVADGSSGHNSAGTKSAQEETLIKDVSMSINVKYKKDGELVDAGTKTVTLPAGTQAQYNHEYDYSAVWAYLPAFGFDGFTTDELQITVTDASAEIYQIKEIEMYGSQGE